MWFYDQNKDFSTFNSMFYSYLDSLYFKKGIYPKLIQESDLDMKMVSPKSEKIIIIPSFAIRSFYGKHHDTFFWNLDKPISVINY